MYDKKTSPTNSQRWVLFRRQYGHAKKQGQTLLISGAFSFEQGRTLFFHQRLPSPTPERKGTHYGIKGIKKVLKQDLVPKIHAIFAIP